MSLPLFTMVQDLLKADICFLALVLLLFAMFAIHTNRQHTWPGWQQEQHCSCAELGVIENLGFDSVTCSILCAAAFECKASACPAHMDYRVKKCKHTAPPQ